MSKSKQTGIAIGMAALALLGLTTGCNRGGSGGLLPSSSDWSWGCLTEADSAGTPAYAEHARVPTGEIVRVWGESSADAVTLEVLGGDFTEIAPGAHEAGPDGMIVADDLVLEVLRCEGESMEEAVCTPIDTASIDVEVLEDGARRVSYRGTSAEGSAIDGSFVVGR